MVLLNRVGNVLGLSSSSKRASWWPVALLALAVPLAIWLASTNVHSSTENQTAAAELNKAPLDKAQLDRAELDRWVEKATSPAQSEFDAAVDALVAMGPEVAQEMIPLLKSGRTDQLGLKVLKRLAPEPSVQRILINAIEEARPNRHPNVIHCGLLALGKSGNLAHAGFIAGFLETHDLAAMSALETLGGERARDHLIGAFDLVPTERWFVLAGKLERLGDPAAVPELKKRLTQVELPPNDRFPPATVGAMTGAISALSDEQETFTTREYCQGQHFQYPFDGPGSPKTFSVNPLKDHYVRLPKVDPQTEAGREAIWKVLAEAIEATADRWLFEHDCRDLGKRGYEDTGPFPLAIGLRFMTVAQFGAQIDTVEMRHPSRQWEYLGLVGWVTLHTGPETPGGLVSKLQEALEKAQAQIGTLNRQALAAQLPQAIQEERDRLLVEADTAIRQGILDLAQRYPLLKKGQPWDRLKLPSESGRIGIYLRRQEGGKGSTDTVPFPPSEAFGILVAVKQPPDQIEQLSLTSLYPSLGLVGQVNTQAADSGLDAALKRLVTEALAPFSELDNLARRVAADKSRSDVSITGQLLGIDGKPAAPGYRVTALPRAWSTQSGMMPTTLTDEQGVFVFHNLPDGPCDVAATPNALTNQPNMRIKGVVLKKGEPVYVKLSLEQEYHFAGQVTDAKGRPQPERNVQAIWKDPSSGKHTYSSNTKTNAFGRYRFSSPFEVAARILVNDGGTTDSPEQQEVKHGQDDVDLQLPADGDLRIRARPATITTQPEKMPPILIDVWNGSEDFELSLQPIAVEIDGEWFQSEGAMIIDRLPPRIMPGKSSFGNKFPAQHLGQYWLNDDDLKRVEFPAEGEYTLRIKFHAMRGAEKRDVITSEVKVGVEKPKDDVTQVNLLGLDDDTLITFFSTGEFLRRVAFDCEAFYDDRDHLPKDVPELASRYQEQSRDSIGIDPFAPDKKLRLILDEDDPQCVQIWSVGPDGDWNGGK